MEKIVILIYLILFCSCSISQKNKELTWNHSEMLLKNKKILQTGDVIIVNKRLDPYSLFGHSAIYIKEYDFIAEYPQFGYGFFYVPIEIWVSEIKLRDVIVLRLKNITSDFRKILEEEIDKNKYKKYKLFLNKNRDDGYYCSQWVWKMFYDTGVHYDLKLDTDGNGGLLVLPYDFLSSNEFEIVELNP